MGGGCWGERVGVRESYESVTPFQYIGSLAKP